MENQIIQQPHLRDYLYVLMKRKWIVFTFFVVLVTTVVIGSYKMKPVYSSMCKLLIEKEISTGVLFAESVGIETSQQDYYQTQYGIIKSRSLAKKVIDKLKLEKDEEFSGSSDIVSSFLKRIAVKPVRNSRLVNIEAESMDPVTAAKMANTLAEIYIKENLKSRFSKSGTNTSIPGKSPYKQLEEISKNKIDIESLPSVLKSYLIQGLKEEYAKLEAVYARLSKRYKKKHPKIIEIKASMAILEKKINQEMKKVVESIKTELSGTLKGNNIRIIDRAEIPKYPVRPKKKLNIILAAILGLFGGVGLAFFIDYLDNTVKTKEDIEKYIGLPFLGHIPVIKIKKKEEPITKHIFTHKEQKSFVSEAFRTLRANVLFSAVTKQLKTILITSSGPSEGKTTVSTNLAITLSQGGEKVLLVDADMRKPVLHRVFKINSDMGISSYLAGDYSLKDIVIKTNVDNLSVVVCGKIPPNPNELLGLERMGEFIEEAKKRFDRIIFDTPPVGGISDGLILSKKVDGVLMVVEYAKLSRDAILLGKEKLQEIGSEIGGVILNNVDIEKEGSRFHPYYYYSYYHYRYGYQQNT